MHDKSFAETILESLGSGPLRCAYDHFNRGNAHAELGRHAEAVADYDRANELEPDYEGGMAWFNRGNSLAALGRVDEAIASWRRPVEIGTIEYGPYANLVGHLRRLGRHDEALETLDAYLAMCEREGIDVDTFDNAIGQAWIARAGVLHGMGKQEDARASIERALELDSDPLVLQTAGDHYALDVGDFGEALEYYERSHAQSSDSEILWRLGITLANLGRRAEAIQRLTEAIEEEPALGPMLREEGWAKHLVDRSILAEIPQGERDEDGDD